jgi:hypothetical protein
MLHFENALPYCKSICGLFHLYDKKLYDESSHLYDGKLYFIISYNTSKKALHISML